MKNLIINNEVITNSYKDYIIIKPNAVYDKILLFHVGKN